MFTSNSKNHKFTSDFKLRASRLHTALLSHLGKLFYVFVGKGRTTDPKLDLARIFLNPAKCADLLVFKPETSVSDPDWVGTGIVFRIQIRKGSGIKFRQKPDFLYLITMYINVENIKFARE